MKKAFTLIEVMVVLSILAIIAILAYNFFGSTMKEARLNQSATKIFNDLRNVVTATEIYEMETGLTLPDGSTGNELVAAGYLKAIPSPDTDVWDGSVALQYDDVNWQSTGLTAAKDRHWYLGLINEDVCIKFNEKYSSDIGATVWIKEANGAVYAQDQQAMCVRNQIGDPVDRNYITMPIEFL